MADFIVLRDWRGSLSGAPNFLLRQGKVISDTEYDVTGLRASGLRAVPFTDKLAALLQSDDGGLHSVVVAAVDDIVANEIAAFVLVQKKSDFPDPVAGVITLLADTVYQLNGVVSIGTDHLALSAGSILSGGFAVRDQLVYTGTGAAIRATGVRLTVSDLTVVAPDEAFTCSSGIVGLVGVAVVSEKFATFTDCPQIVIRGSQGTELDNGIELINPGAGSPGVVMVMLTSSLIQRAGATGVLIDLGTSVWATFRLGDVQLVSVVGGTDISGEADSDNLVAGVGRGQVTTSIVNGAGTHLVGIIPDDTQWSFRLVDGILDSITLGEVTMSGNAVDTEIAVQGTFVKVAGSTTLSVGRRFSGGDPAADNRLRYIAPEPDTFRIAATLGVSKSGALEEGAAQFRKDGSPIGIPFTFQVDPKGRTTLLAITDDAVEDAEYEVWLTNNDSTTDILVMSMVFSIAPIGK